MNDFYIKIGGRIKNRRLELKLTRAKLGQMTNISDKSGGEYQRIVIARAYVKKVD